MWLFPPPFFLFTLIESISCTSLQIDLTTQLINSPLSNLAVANYHLLSDCVRFHGDYLSLCYASKRLLPICVHAWICGWWITSSDPRHHYKNSCLEQSSVVSINMTTAKQGFMLFQTSCTGVFKDSQATLLKKSIQQYSDQLM